MSIEIQSTDVIKLILQFLKEQGLTESFNTLSTETGVTLPTLNDPHQLYASIIEGDYIRSLSLLKETSISPSKLYDFYELLFFEMVLKEEFSAAKLILRSSSVMISLRESDLSRYLKLENILSQVLAGGIVTEGDLFKGSNTKERKEKVARKLEGEFVKIPSGRLLSLLGDALKLQVQQNDIPPDTTYDIFHGLVPKGAVHSEDAPIGLKSHSMTKHLHPHYAEYISYSPDGKHLILGFTDGRVEFWNPINGNRRLDLSFQSSGSVGLRVNGPVSCLSLSEQNNFLAVGTITGNLNIFRTDNGIMIKEYSKILPDGVSIITIDRRGTSLLLGGLDGTIKGISLKTGGVIFEQKQHSSFITDLSFLQSSDLNLFLSSGADGKLCLWKGSAIQKSWTPFSNNSLTAPLIRKIIPLSDQDQVIIISHKGDISILDLKTFQLKDLPSVNHKDKLIMGATLSPRQSYLYLAFEDGAVSCHEISNFKEVFEFQASEIELIGVVHNPILNQLVSYDTSGKVCFWSP